MTGPRSPRSSKTPTTSPSAPASSAGRGGTTTSTPPSTRSLGPATRKSSSSSSIRSTATGGRIYRGSSPAGTHPSIQNGQRHQKPFLLHPPEKSQEAEQNLRLKKFYITNARDKALRSVDNNELPLRPVTRHRERTISQPERYPSTYQDLPSLIFEFANFKPIKTNLKFAKVEDAKIKISEIFELINRFKYTFCNPSE